MRATEHIMVFFQKMDILLAELRGHVYIHIFMDKLLFGLGRGLWWRLVLLNGFHESHQGNRVHRLTLSKIVTIYTFDYANSLSLG